MADKIRLEVRLDAPLNAAVKDLADRTDVSVNRLVQGILRWAVQNANVGRPEPIHSSGTLIVETVEEPGVVWFGDDGWTDQGDGPSGDGDIHFVLDFSDRHALRSGLEYFRD